MEEANGVRGVFDKKPGSFVPRDATRDAAWDTARETVGPK